MERWGGKPVARGIFSWAFARSTHSRERQLRLRHISLVQCHSHLNVRPLSAAMLMHANMSRYHHMCAYVPASYSPRTRGAGRGRGEGTTGPRWECWNVQMLRRCDGVKVRPDWPVHLPSGSNCNDCDDSLPLQALRRDDCGVFAFVVPGVRTCASAPFELVLRPFLSIHGQCRCAWCCR